MRKWPAFCVFGFLVLTSRAATGPGPPASDSVDTLYSHRIWRIEDGLPQNRIRAIAQTPNGYLWVGTSEGLARFDGVRFTVFDRSNTPALQDNGVLALRLTRDGTLWIGTEGGGLASYKNGLFQSFGPAKGLTNGFVRCIYEDRDNTLWVGTDRGFFRLNGSSFVRLDGTPEIPLASVSSVAQDEQGRLWIRTAAGLLTIIDGKLVKSGSCSLAIRTIVEAGSSLWALNETGGAPLRDDCRMVGGTLPDLPVRSLASDTEGALWIGTAGMGLIREENGHRTTLTASDLLPDNTINSIFEDRDQNLWIGTEDGLLRLSRSHIVTVGGSQGLEDDNVLTTYAAGPNVWMVTATGQVYLSNNKGVTRFHLPSPAGDLRVRTVMEDRAGTLWFGTLGGGLVRLTNGKAVVYSKQAGLRSPTIRQLLQDRSGGIWIALDSGLSHWDGRSFRNYYLEDGLSYPSTRCMIEDANGDILVGTDAGLNRIHDGKIVPDANFSAVSSEKIWTIYQGSPGTLWIGTRGGGLLRLRAGKVSRFGTSSGLPSNTIYQILEDGTGKFWMSTSSGIFSAGKQELERAADSGTAMINVTSYGTADGMKTSQMNGGFQPAGTATATELWFPTVKGAIRINPSAMPVRRIPPILIERVLVDDVPVPYTGDVIIPPGHQKFQIDFTLCDLFAPQRANFLYKLEGFDENWNSALRTRSVSYTNLRPRKYRFRVVANDSASSNTSEASLSVTLRPQFYQTIWFFVAAILSCGLAVWGGMARYARWTGARYRLVMSERLAERNRVAREMHDTVIQGCVGVATLLEAIDRFRGTNIAEAGRLLDDARSQITATLDEARRSIWNLRYAAAENASITILFDLARKLGAEHHIEIETELTGQGELDPETDRTLLLVGRESLRNAVAHAQPSRIRFSITLTPSQAVLQVLDDGVGFSAPVESAAGNRHFGIIGMRERVEKAGGSFLLETGPGQGTRIVANLPLSRRSLSRIPFVTTR